MATALETVRDYTGHEYKYGFVTEIESDIVPKGLDEDVVRLISAKKNEPAWMTEWRLKALARWRTVEEPTWAKVEHPPIDFQAISYYAAPKSDADRPKSLAEVDPELLRTYERLGIPIREQELLAGVAVDYVFDSVSVATTFKEKLGELGVIFCSISEALRDHPELVRRYLGSVVPQGDNFYAALNSAVFSDGSFVYVPKGVRCPMELSTYFRINAAETGQFERTLIIADEGAYVSYLEGCTAPQRDENQLHAAVVELIALDDAQIKYSTVQNWYPGDQQGRGGIYNFVTKRGACRGRRSKISWTQVETGSAITWKYPSCILQGDEFGGRVLLGRADQQSSAGRHRHQDGAHRQEHALAHRLEGHLRGPQQQHLSRSGAGAEGCGQRAQPHPVRLDADRRPLRRPHRALHRGQEPLGPGRARGDHLQDQRGPDVLLPPARAGGRGCGRPDRQRLLQGGDAGAADGVRGRGPEAARDQPGGQRRLRPRISRAGRAGLDPYAD